MIDRGKSMLRILSCLILVSMVSALLLTSCATEMSTRASRVRLVSAVQAHQVENKCKFLGNVSGASFFWGGCCLSWGFLREVPYNNALNELLDNAAELGATHVFVNLGTGEGLRGDAYRCAYCRAPDGDPDVGYCQGRDGKPDVALCHDPDGNIVGSAFCEGAEGKNRAECKANCGKWVPAIDQNTCEADGNKWVTKAEERTACEAKGGTWIPGAEDQITCESKGGTWVINEDVLRREPEDLRK
jgi:hypothetical protein